MKVTTANVQPPLLGMGTFNSWLDHEEVGKAIVEGIKAGYRHFDLASMYENEAEIGAAIRSCISKGIVARDELYICTKLWMNDCDPNDVEPAIRASLKRTGLEYFDNYMMHRPAQWTKSSRRGAGGVFDYAVVHAGDKNMIAATWAAMEKLIRIGLTRSIGVSNFDQPTLQHLIDNCKIIPRVHEFEFHPYLQQRDMVSFCLLNDIHIIAYAPLGKGIPTNPSAPILLEDPIINKIATSLGRTAAQVILRWLIQKSASVIPKSLNKSHIKENRDILDWCLSNSHMEKIDGLEVNHRYINLPSFEFEEAFSLASRPSHPDLANQPFLKPGQERDDGLYRNCFGRQGRTLHSEIFVKKGILREIDLYCSDFLPVESLGAKNYVVVDEICDELLDCDNTFVKALHRAGVDAEKIVVPSSTDDTGETSTEPYKTNVVFNDCVQAILENGVSKHSCIISVGGGVVNNLCGVLAGMIYRGIHLVHFTTTTMGMLDAALDFKQAINHDLGKNLLGCYYPASRIVIDPEVCKTLSIRHVRNGIAESLKHALCQSVELVNQIVEPVKEGGDAVMQDSSYIEEICKASIEIKVPTLDHYSESDFNEMCPQYGHAIGHAIESLSWTHSHEPLLHGEAVAIGMCVSAEIAYGRGLCDEECVEQHYSACLDVGLPAHIPPTMTTEMIMSKIIYDKHYVKAPAMGLVAKVGEMAYDRVNKTFAYSISSSEISRAIDCNMEKACPMCLSC